MASRSKVALLVAIAVAAIAFILWNDGDGERAPAGPFEYDRARPLEASVHDVPGPPGFDDFRLSYLGADGGRVRARLRLPSDRAAAVQCVIWEGGLGYTLRDFDLPSPLANTRYGWITIEPRPSGERALAAARTPRRLLEMMRSSVIDLRRGLDYLETSGECLEDVGYVGGSFGGLVGALLAGADERIDAAALLAAGGGWPALIAGKPDFLLPRVQTAAATRRATQVLDAVDPARSAPSIAPRPVLMINGRRDTMITPEAATNLHAAARQPKSIDWYAGGHFDLAGDLGLRIYRKVRTFLVRALGPA